MTVFTFDNVLFVISGPIHVRIHNILNTMLVAKAFNAKFKLYWVKDDQFNYELDDIYQTICFVNNITTTIDIVKDTAYYYNPSVPIDVFLMSCVPNGHEDKFPDKEFSHLEWIIFDNFAGKKQRMISDAIMSTQQYENNLQELKSELLYSIHIDGYINLFQNIQNEQAMLCLFINPDDNIEEYFKYIDQIPDQLFVTFHWNMSKTNKEDCQQKLREKYKDKFMFVSHDTHTSIIEFFCLHYCTVVATLHSMDEYLQNAVGSKTIVYSLSKHTMHNTSLKHLQKLM